MKIFLALLTIFLFTSVADAKMGKSSSKSSSRGLTAEQKIKLENMKIYLEGQKVNRRYTFISPVSEKGRNEQGVFKMVKKAAAKLGADAVIDFKCKETFQQEIWVGAMRSSSYCSGKAVKWK